MEHHKFVSIIFLSLLLSIIIVYAIFYRVDGYKFVYGNIKYPTNNIDEQDWREFEEFREWKRLRNEFAHHNIDKSSNYNREIYDSYNDIHSMRNPKINWDFKDPPPIDHPALVGRYVVNQAIWTSVATISTNKNIATFPFVNVVAVSDGPLGNGTGIPYIFLTPLDFTTKDAEVDSRVTFMMTLAQGNYCQQKLMDPIDPRCARIILSGRIEKIPVNSTEHEIAKSSVFDRHPTLINMPTDHDFFFAKLNISFIAVLDYYGGAKIISPEDYFQPRSLHQKYMFNNKYHRW